MSSLHSLARFSSGLYVFSKPLCFKSLLKLLKVSREIHVVKYKSSTTTPHSHQKLSCLIYFIHNKKLNCLKSGVESDMNDIFYEFKYSIHHFFKTG